MNRKQRSCIEVDLRSLEHNLQLLRNCIGNKVINFMAVVKADAYGHGDCAIVKALSDKGIHYFAVSNIDEAIRIRKITEDEILVLGYTPVERADELVRYGITQTLLSDEYAEELSGTNSSIKCQFAIDAGMRRIGLNADDPISCKEIIRKYADRLNLEGLFTHL